MPRGSTTKRCVSCKEVIGVAAKTCKICKAVQPTKQRLAKKLDKFKAKKEGWLENQKKKKKLPHMFWTRHGFWYVFDICNSTSRITDDMTLFFFLGGKVAYIGPQSCGVHCTTWKKDLNSSNAHHSPKVAFGRSCWEVY